MGVDVADRDQANQERVPAPELSPQPTSTAVRAVGAEPLPFSLEGLLLFDSDAGDPVDIDTLTFAEDGIGVVRSRGEQARVLPWSSVVTHVVEAWSGGVVPEWWVDPELDRNGSAGNFYVSVTDPDATSRPIPHVEDGALIGIKTPSGTYRFLLPGGDARALSRKVTEFTVKHQGPTGASSVTRVVAWGQDIERRSVKRKPQRAITWSSIQPILVVVLILFLGTAVALILLQSAGTIHLPYLGGTGSGTISWLRTR